TPLEALLRRLVAATLNQPEAGLSMTMSLASYGFTSLRLMRLLQQIRSSGLMPTASVPLLLQNHTIEAIAVAIEREHPDRKALVRVLEKGGGSGRGIASGSVVRAAEELRLPPLTYPRRSCCGSLVLGLAQLLGV